MGLIYKIIFGCLCAAWVTCFVVIVYSVQYNIKCVEQGGIPVNDVCIKAETIKVVY